MRWFQRYGIPGGYFLLFLTLWVLVFYPCQITEIKNNGGINLVGIVAISFISIGYCLSVLAQCLYLNIPKLGIVGNAINRSEVFTNNSKSVLKKEHLKEVHSLLYVIENGENKIERQKMLINWVANRNDILTINFSLFLATITVPFLAYLGPKILLGWNAQSNTKGGFFLGSISVALCLLFIFSYIKLRQQNVEIIKGWYSWVSGINYSELKKKDSVGEAKDKVDKENAS